MNTLFTPTRCQRTRLFLLISIGLTLVTAIITFFVMTNGQQIVAFIDGRKGERPVNLAGFEKVWRYFTNNGLKVPLQMFMLAFIPIPFLYTLNLILTEIVMGIVIGMSLRLDMTLGSQLILASLPHYLIETLSYCILAVFLYELNKLIRAKLRAFFKRMPSKGSFLQQLFIVISVFVCLFIPLIILAALLETYATDFIFSVLN